MANNVTAIELSTSGIRMTVGYVQNGKVFVLQALQGERIPLDGDGKISVQASEESIALLFQTARKALGERFDFGPVIAIFPSHSFKSKEGEGSTLTVDKASHISQLDYANCINIIQKEVKEDGFAAVCCSPFLFIYDNQVKREFLPGNVSEKLTVKADCMLLDSGDVQRYRKIFNDLDIFPYLELVDVYAALCFLMATNIPEKFLFLSLAEDEYCLSIVEERRLLYAESHAKGLVEGLKAFANKTGADLKEATTFARLFGFQEDEESIFAPLPHVLTLQEGRKKFEESFSDLLSSIQDLCREIHVEQNIPLVLYGVGSEIPGIDGFLSEATGRETYIVNNNSIGARNQDFIPCLGAIKASSLPYQLSSHEGRRQADDEVMKKTYFGRN